LVSEGEGASYPYLSGMLRVLLKTTPSHVVAVEESDLRLLGYEPRMVATPFTPQQTETPLPPAKE